MATKRIERADLVAPNAIKSVTEETKILIAELEKLLKVQKEMVKTNAFKNSKDVKKFNDDLTVAKSTTKALETAQKQLKKSTEEEAKAKIIQANATKKQKQELQDLIIQEDKQAGTLQKLAANSRTLRREREGLNLNTKKGEDRLKQINIQLDKNNLKVKKNSDALKKQKIKRRKLLQRSAGGNNSDRSIFKTAFYIAKNPSGSSFTYKKTSCRNCGIIHNAKSCSNIDKSSYQGFEIS